MTVKLHLRLMACDIDLDKSLGSFEPVLHRKPRSPVCTAQLMASETLINSERPL